MSDCGICSSCGFAYDGVRLISPMRHLGVMPEHLANPYERGKLGESCDGSGKPPRRLVSAGVAKKHNDRWRPVAACRGVGDAAVVLDAVSSHREDLDAVLADLGATLGDYIALALKGYRARYPWTRIGTSWRWIYRPSASRMRGRGDIYCIFCGELVVEDVADELQRALRGKEEFPSVAQQKICDRVYTHATACALQCLAGMRPYAAPDVRRLPGSEEP